MANNKKNAAKSAQKTTKTTKKAPVAPAAAPATEQPAVQMEEQKPATKTTAVVQKPEAKAPSINDITGHATSGLDANRRMDMITNIRVYFHDDPKAAAKYGQNTVDIMEKVAVTGLVAAVADEIADGKSTLAVALIKQDMYPALVVAGADMGITLPALNALPAPNEEGVIEVPVDQIEVSEETKQALKEENEIVNKIDANNIELDPRKIAHMSEEDVKTALTYLMIKKPKQTKCGIGETLVAVRDFIHAYRKELASMAENKDEAMKKIINRSTYEELNDAFSFVKPTFLFSKIGEGLDDITFVEKCPLSAFIIVRTLLTDKEGNVAWTDEDIASATLAIIELYCNEEIRKTKEIIATLEDEKQINAKKDYIADRKKVLSYLYNFNFDICEYDKQEKFTEGFNATISKARGRVLVSYYPEYKNIDNDKVHINLNENVSQRAGIILNLFRDSGNKNVIYNESNILPIETKDYEAKKEESATAETEESKN